MNGASFQGSNLAGAVIDRRTYDRHYERLTAASNIDQIVVTAD